MYEMNNAITYNHRVSTFERRSLWSRAQDFCEPFRIIAMPQKENRRGLTMSFFPNGFCSTMSSMDEKPEIYKYRFRQKKIHYYCRTIFLLLLFFIDFNLDFIFILFSLQQFWYCIWSQYLLLFFFYLFQFICAILIFYFNLYSWFIDFNFRKYNEIVLKIIVFCFMDFSCDYIQMSSFDPKIVVYLL